ncbi:ABC transporter ATP-binding protein [Shewanella fodinae]|uniref:ABC-2 type transport system ATP-binding protein n=1 Tax=Shewanella fodinae TaxID=552357 RepID=A0A4R2FIS0_9GAMM|nr:ABC transporter ATP-binding protein [Shewanella fodinae]TCN87115.1 ABC-2 type transport system ATP-binding protein [Shewanella fodinae]
MDALLQLNKVVKRFEANTVLDEVSFTLEPGMVVGLLGANGAGKSTLMRIALGIIDADAGDIETLGEAPAQLSVAAKEATGYVPQQPFGYENATVAMALALHRSFYASWDMQLEQQWLQRFALDGKTKVNKLSVGQRQALAIIMAMAYRPKLLLLDEPVASLDPLARRQFMADLFELALESGSAVLFSSHITSDLERVASHVALLKNGKLLLMRELDEIKEHIRLVTFPEGVMPTFGEHIRVLHRREYSWLIDGYRGETWAGALQCQALNLEQLYLELHI